MPVNKSGYLKAVWLEIFGPAFSGFSVGSYFCLPARMVSPGSSKRTPGSFRRTPRGPLEGPRGPFNELRGPFQGHRSPLKGDRGPLKGPRGPLKGPRGPFKGSRGPFKGPSVAILAQVARVPLPVGLAIECTALEQCRRRAVAMLSCSSCLRGAGILPKWVRVCVCAVVGECRFACIEETQHCQKHHCRLRLTCP